MHTIDVDANLGNWTRKTIEYSPDTTCTRFEPQDDLKRHAGDLLDGGFTIRWINARDTPGRPPFTISHRNDSSTFMPVD
jgi:hypothetical protein